MQRIFVHTSIARSLASQMVNKAKALVVGDPISDRTEVGPLIRSTEVDRVDLWVKEAVAGGAQLLCGGDKLDFHCYAPTILFDSPYDASVSNPDWMLLASAFGWHGHRVERSVDVQKKALNTACSEPFLLVL